MLFATLIGSLSFSGSIIAYLKLEGKFEKPHTFPGQNFLNGLILLVILGLCGWLTFNATGGNAIIAFIVMFCARPVFRHRDGHAHRRRGHAGRHFAFEFLHRPRGGGGRFCHQQSRDDRRGHARRLVRHAADAAHVQGDEPPGHQCFVRRVWFQRRQRGAAGGVAGTVKPIQADEVALLLTYAQRVVIVPGYGMAVAQAQHSVRELSDELGKRGVEVQFAIHPVAGRMPGHMNVLLAEANVPYDQLIEMEQINPTMDRVDVCLVIGANDVVNPAAREEKSSPIYGMPIIEADHAKSVIVMKRSMAAGFAGIENHLFYKDNTRMLFGDAKASLNALVAAVKAS